jgi:hypothetical protein
MYLKIEHPIIFIVIGLLCCKVQGDLVNSTHSLNATAEALEISEYLKLKSEYTKTENIYYKNRVDPQTNKFERGKVNEYFHDFDFRNIKTILRTELPNDYIILRAKILANYTTTPIIIHQTGGLNSITRLSLGKYNIVYKNLKLISEVYVSFSFISESSLSYRMEEMPSATNCTVIFVDKNDSPSEPIYFLINLLGY